MGADDMVEQALQPEIHGLLERKNFSALKALIRGREVHDLAGLLSNPEGEDLSPES